MTRPHPGRKTADTLTRGLGRRGFMNAAMAFGAGGAALGLGACSTDRAGGSASASGASAPPSGAPSSPLQPGTGEILGDVHLGSDPDEVLWGYLPGVDARPAARMTSGQTLTVDTVSHEGILEDQGRDPVAWFGERGVAEEDVLEDAVAIARDYDRTTRVFDVDGPHVVTGPVFVEGAEPGDVLKIETLQTTPRVPYGVVSNRHGKGTLAQTDDGGAPAGIGRADVMPPIEADGRGADDPQNYGNVSVFTRLEGDQGVMDAGDREIRFPLNPFLGMVGVASATSSSLTDEAAHSVPPTISGGNLDVADLGAGSTLYLPVSAEGALFYTGDPHMAQGDGEVALTALEGSLRATFRLTVCKPGSGDAPEVAFSGPFGETEDHWISIGLSDAHGRAEEITGDLDRAMRRSVAVALTFLQQELSVPRDVAYAYLSAAADFALSQVVDQTVGVHGRIRKADFT